MSQPLTDLGLNPYVRLDGEVTEHQGGLYPGGVNSRPSAHEAAGLALAQSVLPLDASGQPDAAAGRIVLLGLGMSNTALEFRAFRDLVRADPAVNARLVVVSGAAAGQVAERWLDPHGLNWQHIEARLRHDHVTTAQVQAAWVKLTRTGGGEFPEKAQQLQSDLSTIARNLLQNYPNLKLVYLSSRTRAYTYWHGLSPEPLAFETGFAVKWLVEQQIAADPSLNFDPAYGPVVAPWLSWGPYLWVDGQNPRGDGRVWPPYNLERDCAHPSGMGVAQVAAMLLEFFKTDTTAQGWFLANPSPAMHIPPAPTFAPPASTPNRAWDKCLTPVCIAPRRVCVR